MIVRMHLGRRIGYVVWVLLSVLLALLTGLGLLDAIQESGSLENRAPVERIVLAAIALAVALVTTNVVVRRSRAADGRVTLGAGLALTATTIVLLFLVALAGFASGPL